MGKIINHQKCTSESTLYKILRSNKVAEQSYCVACLHKLIKCKRSLLINSRLPKPNSLNTKVRNEAKHTNVTSAQLLTLTARVWKRDAAMRNVERYLAPTITTVVH